MAKHILAVMPDKEFKEGTKLDKLVFGRLFKGDKHPLRVILKKLKDYHAIPKAKIKQRHDLLTAMVEDCVEYAGTKAPEKKASTKVQTVLRLASQATNVIALENERASQLAEQVTGATATAKGKGQATLAGGFYTDNKFEVLNKAGEAAIRGDDLVIFARDKYGVELTGDDSKDWYAMKKVLKLIKSKHVEKLNLIYLNAEQRDDACVLFIDDKPKGWVVTLAGDRVSTASSPTGTFIYAVDPDGYFYTAKGQDKPNVDKLFHHSSFLAGRPALCAGNLRITDGRLIEIDNGSGHYRPTLENLLTACELILATGYDPSGDGYILFSDHGSLLVPGQTGTYRVPFHPFMEKRGLVDDAGDFELSYVRIKPGVLEPKYVKLEAAKARGCTGCGVV